jgi:mono/diheme cytochrome c family protein
MTPATVHAVCITRGREDIVSNLFRITCLASAALVGWAAAPSIHSGSLESQPSRGAEGYERYCATCHGTSGRGDGVLAPYLETKPSDLTLLRRSHEGFYPANLVRHALDGSSVPKARGAMPDWGSSLRGDAPSASRLSAAETIDGIVEYVETLQEAQHRRVALCVFANDGVPEQCVEATGIAPSQSAGDACSEILMCLNGATCARHFCVDTTVREGWRLESASRITFER